METRSNHEIGTSRYDNKICIVERGCYTLLIMCNNTARGVLCIFILNSQTKPFNDISSNHILHKEDVDDRKKWRGNVMKRKPTLSENGL